MSFRKRNVVVAQPGNAAAVSKEEKVVIPGVRPSPLDGRATISTGTRSLDNLLAGHAGLPLGTSLLVEESGTTDFGGALLRYYAAEGVVQGHHIHCLGVSELWSRELPGIAVAEKSSRIEEKKPAEDKMKIAWRYERLGEFGAGVARGGCCVFVLYLLRSNYRHISHAFPYSKLTHNREKYSTANRNIWFTTADHILP